MLWVLLILLLYNSQAWRILSISRLKGSGSSLALSSRVEMEADLDLILRSIKDWKDRQYEPAMLNAGLLSVSLGKKDGALEIFRRAVKLNPRRDASWFNLAQLEEAFDSDTETVLNAYGNAIESTESDIVASACFNNMFELLMRVGRSDEAAQCIDQALQELPNDPRAWLNAGMIMREAGQLNISATCFANSAFHCSADNITRALALNNLGDIYCRLAQWSKAVETYKSATSADPADVDSHYSLALLQRDILGDFRAAKASLEACISSDQSHSQASFQLAALIAGENPEMADATKAPQQYISELFDHYANHGYEDHMLKDLQYRGHSLVVEGAINLTPWSHEGEMKALLGEDSVVFDIGCGTGLVGGAWRSKGAVGELKGCDLSKNMCSAAKGMLYERQGGKNGDKKLTSKVYSEVRECDCEVFLGTENDGSADAILAGDVCCYYGELSGLFVAVERCLRPGGIFVFTVESSSLLTTDSGSFVLQPSARFAHSLKYVRETATACGMSLSQYCEQILRLQGGDPVKGVVVVLRKPKS